MQSRFILLLVCALAPCANARPALADGGAIRLLETRGELQITVFTSPTPVRTGGVDVSVLLCEPASAASTVDIFAHPIESPLRAIRAKATNEAATNKLLRAAKFQLPQPGRWRIEAIVSRGDLVDERFAFEVDVAAAAPRWLTFWPWFMWPAVAIALLFVHQRQARRCDH